MGKAKLVSEAPTIENKESVAERDVKIGELELEIKKKNIQLGFATETEKAKAEEISRLKSMLSEEADKVTKLTEALKEMSMKSSKLEGKLEILNLMLAQTQHSAEDATGLLYDQLRAKNPAKKSKRSEVHNEPAA